MKTIYKVTCGTPALKEDIISYVATREEASADVENAVYAFLEAWGEENYFKYINEEHFVYLLSYDASPGWLVRAIPVSVYNDINLEELNNDL